MSPVMRPCLSHGCPNLVEAKKGGPSYCPEHQRGQNRRHYERVSPGTTPAWARTVKRIKRRAGNRCERCGKPEQKMNGRSTHQVHHLDGSEPGAGGSIRTPTPDSRLLYVCRPCHVALHAEMRAQRLAQWQR